MSYLDSLFSLSGKNAVVTGASKGLGRAAAIALSRAGAHVTLVGRDEDGLHETQKATGAATCEIVAADVRDAAKTLEIIQNIVSRSGTLDILINNAGIIRRSP